MLEPEGITRRFSERTVLQDVSFSVAPGRLTGFVGANGAGKTTAMRIVLGVLAAHAGSVRWHGKDVDLAARRRFGGDEELPDGLSRAVTEALLATQVEQRLLDPPPPDEGLAILLSAGFSVLFFFTVFVFGLQIAQSVVEEKQSRVVELLVAAVPVRLLLAGKVVGNTTLALGQIVLLVAVAMVGASLAGQARLLALLLQASGGFLLFFLLGFTMLACLWAVAGAVASRQEELQSTTLPLQMLVVLPFFAAIYVTEPGPALTVLSYLPVSSPLVMPRRILLGEVSVWEPLLAAAIIAVTAVLLVRVAARLYEGSLLRTGTRTTLSQAWSSGRS